MSPNRRTNVIVILAIMTSAFEIGTAFADKVPPPKRARPPKWIPDVLDVFFEDVRDQLVGERPDYGGDRRTASNSQGSDIGGESQTDSELGTEWSKLIDAETIETEVKRLAQSLAADVATLSEFKGGRYQDCRRHFSVLAILFAVGAEYDGNVRWHDSAAGLRDLFARAGFNCKIGTDQSYRDASLRQQDLADLVGGARPQLPTAERTTNWSKISDRPPLMQRINIAHEVRLTKWLTNDRQFARHRDDVRHESQLVGVMANVIGREGFEYWDDESYARYARELCQAAADISAAAALDNFPQARAAAARMTKACSDCHDGYRG